MDSKTLIAATIFIVAVFFTVSLFSRGTVISGVGNSANRIYAEPAAAQLADVLTEGDVAPPVGDDVLKAAFDALLAKATAGDIEAALVVFAVAARQRQER
jgi:hypothetical protein